MAQAPQRTFGVYKGVNKMEITRPSELEYLKVDEVASILRADPQTVRRMCNNGKFANARKRNRQWLIPRSDVDRYLDQSDVA